MKQWEERFFAQNKKSEVELEGVSFADVFRGLDVLGWNRDDEFWVPDLQVVRFLRDEDEIFIIQETYFDPKLTGSTSHIKELGKFLSKIDPDEKLNAGSKLT